MRETRELAAIFVSDVVGYSRLAGADEDRILARLRTLRSDLIDGELKGIFELQDQVTERVVGVVEPSLRKSEIQRSRQKRPDSLEAYDLFVHASPYLTVLSPANLPMAAQFLKGALELEPNYAAAHAHLAWCPQIGFMTAVWTRPTR